MLGLSFNKTYFISYAIGIISMTLSIYILFNILKQYIENNFLNLIVFAGIILNCFFIDYFI